MISYKVTGPDGLEEIVSAHTKQEALQWIAENFDVDIKKLKVTEIK